MAEIAADGIICRFLFLKLQLTFYAHSVMIIYTFSSNKFRRWRRGLPPLLAYLTLV